ncbi:hypothetical protein DFS34DRAFT_182628 [Phlyctochytrium arcticum]|nr:hypothetical protein DFS34DRAFT_182628 [Phlyctochytrium arcticum]
MCEEYLVDKSYLQMERFQLARFSRMEGDECEPAHVNSICRDRFPRVQELCDRGLPNNGLMMVKINLNLHHLRTGDFRNVSVFETTRARTIECTTTVYHFGQRILETKEIQYPVRNGEGKAPDDVHSSSTQMPSSGEPYPDPSAINEEERVNMTLHPSTDSIPSLLDPIAALSLAGEDPADQQHLQDLAAAYPDPFMGTPFAQLLAESATLAQDPSSSSSSVFPSFLSSTTPSNGSPAMPSSWSPQSSTSSNSGANGARHIYHFDFVRQFFSAFLAGFQCLKLDVEKMIAIDNLSVMQVTLLFIAFGKS